MGKTTYSIRKGFDYQDHYCALTLLETLEQGALEARFQIESDEVDHIDDLVVRVPKEPPTGNQVKFHTTQDHCESFETLMKRKTPQSRSLIEKLLKGWKQLSDDGDKECRIVFISSNGVTRGRYTFGSAIDTATGRIGAKFFSSNDYKKSREALAAHLKVPEAKLQAFLQCVVWKFSYESIEGLRRLARNGLRRLNLPADDAAIAQLMETVAYCATEQQGELTLEGFVQLLWKCSRFRESCEQRFAGIQWDGKEKRRANQVIVVVVKLDCLPAYSGSEFVCSEEPLPLEDYRLGLTVPGLSANFSGLRSSWRAEYGKWNQRRIQSILPALQQFGVDVVAFPRFALDLECAATVAQWCQKHDCNASVGGHSLPLTSSSLARYESDLGVTFDWQSIKPEELKERVIDIVIRCGRAGRSSISHMQSPYKSNETVETDIQTFDLQCHDGWITVGSFPSLAAVNKYCVGGGHAPELILSSCGVHAYPIIRRIHEAPTLHGVPLSLASASLHVPPLVGNAQEDEAARSTGEWEGISVYRIDYVRSVGTGWTATVELVTKLPVVYNGSGVPADPSKFNEWVDSMQGAVDSRSESAATLRAAGRANLEQRLLLIIDEDPSSFFVRRARQAETAIREHLGTASPDEVRLLASPLEEITRAREKRERSIVKASIYAPAPPQVVVPRPLSFIDRAEERRTVARFVEGSTEKRILLLHGTPGIGKRALLAEVQRTDPFGRDWIRFRCVEDASLSESLAQLMIRLGEPQTQPLAPNLMAYEAICKQMATAKCRILVLEDAHNLPIESGNIDHASLLEFFAFVCRTDMQPRPRILLTSDWRGHLNFSGSHLLETVKLDGLDGPDMLYMLQELAATVSSKYPPPTVDELELIASKTHGHPFVGQLAITALENSPPSEVIEKLHQRDEVRRFVINKLLGRASLSQTECRFLQLASVFRIPVLGSAFSGVAGAQTNSIIAELVNRFLLAGEGDRYKLHPLISEYFKSQIGSSEDVRSLQKQAHNYFQSLQRVRSLTLDEKIESIYHAFASGNQVHLEDLRLFTGPVRTAMFDALRERDWPRVHAAADQILRMFPDEAVAKVANAVALDATGESGEAEKFFDSVRMLDSEHLWVAIEFARSRIRRRDFSGAERILEELEQRFSTNRSVQLAWAQLNEKQGLSDEAIQRCQAVLADAGCKERDAFLAGLILRDANRLDLLIEHVEARHEGFPTNAGLQRLYGYACVVTDYAPADGLQALSQQWSAAPDNGYVIADYASALSLTGRTVDASQLFEQGLQDCKGSSNDRRALLEEYALFLGRSGNKARAHEMHRELLRSWPYHLHNHRRFAQSLLDTASAARTSGGRGLEDACVQEAEQVIRKLLEIAPEDKWAAGFLHRIQHRTY